MSQFQFLGFWVSSQFRFFFVDISVLSFVTIWVVSIWVWFCYNMIWLYDTIGVEFDCCLSFFSLVTIWFFELCHSWVIWVFDLSYFQFEFCHNLSSWFVLIWVFKLPLFKFLSCQNLGFCKKKNYMKKSFLVNKVRFFCFIKVFRIFFY